MEKTKKNLKNLIFSLASKLGAKEIKLEENRVIFLCPSPKALNVTLPQIEGLKLEVDLAW